VIAGGESGAKSRPMNPEWAESIRDQCQRADVPFHFKQWGHWGPQAEKAKHRSQTVQFIDRKGRPIKLFKLGKGVTGRVLSGRTWDGFPV
jgi:protein gp37